MVELALDLGGNLGFCIRVKKGHFISGVKDFTKSSNETKHTKLIKIETWLNGLHGKYHIDKIYYESVDFGLNTYATQSHGAIKGKINEFAEKNGIPIEGFAVPTVKKSLTGRGNASKMGMVHFAEKYVGYEVDDDNEADAIGVMHTGRKGRK